MDQRGRKYITPSARLEYIIPINRMAMNVHRKSVHHLSAEALSIHLWIANVYRVISLAFCQRRSCSSEFCTDRVHHIVSLYCFRPHRHHHLSAVGFDIIRKEEVHHFFRRGQRYIIYNYHVVKAKKHRY